jgi:hypothetical protein
MFLYYGHSAIAFGGICIAWNQEFSGVTDSDIACASGSSALRSQSRVGQMQRCIDRYVQ